MKRTIIVPLLMLLAACTDTPAESFAKAQTAFAKHDYPAAKVLVASALAQQPGDTAMLLLQARTLVALGDGEGAGAALEKLAGATPSGELAELAAEAALLRQSPDKALALLGSAASPEAERLRALAAIQQGRMKDAGDLFAKAITAGGNPRVYADYSRYRLLTGDVAGAQEMAEKATKAAPDALDTLLVRGQLATRGGDLEAALTHFTRAEKLYPASLPALTGKAAILGDLGRDKEMQAAIARAAAFAPRDLTVVFLGARAASARKDWAAVRAAVQPIEADLPPAHPLRQIYAEALLRLGQTELAMAQLRPVLTAQPANREIRSLLAEAQLAAGDAAGALTVLRPGIDTPGATSADLALAARAAKTVGDPKVGHYLNRSKLPPAQALGRDLIDGDAAMRAGNWAGAAQSYGRILTQAGSDNVMVLNNMAYAQSMLGNHAKAIEYAQAALKLAPANASVLDTAGWAQLRSGKDLETARRLLRSAAQKAPDNLTIRTHLAEAERARS